MVIKFTSSVSVSLYSRLLSTILWSAVLFSPDVANVDAQILNIEKSALDRDTTKRLLGNLTTSFVIYNRSAASDNPVNFLGFEWKSSFAYFTEKHRLSSINQFSYLRINDDTFLNTGYQHFRFNLFKDRKVHPEFFAQYQYDNFRGLDPRLLAGAGMRHRLYKNEHFTFIFSVGGMFEFERWKHPVTEAIIDKSLWKSTNYIIVRIKITGSADLNAIQYFQTGYDSEIKSFRNRYNAELNLNTRISKKLSWTTTFSINYDHKPIVPITRTIYNFSNGISFKI